MGEGSVQGKVSASRDASARVPAHTRLPWPPRAGVRLGCRDSQWAGVMTSRSQGQQTSQGAAATMSCVYCADIWRERARLHSLGPRRAEPTSVRSGSSRLSVRQVGSVTLSCPSGLLRAQHAGGPGPGTPGRCHRLHRRLNTMESQCFARKSVRSHLGALRKDFLQILTTDRSGNSYRS